MLDLTLDQWRRVLNVNLLAPIEISNAAVRRMGPGSAIVNVSSVLGQVSAPTRGPYCVSKSALISLTKMQAIEWAERGIRVNAIAPGYIINEPTRALAASGSFDLSAINRRTQMGGLGTEQEVAEGIAFLLSPDRASYITGHTLEVNGGWTAYGYLSWSARMITGFDRSRLTVADMDKSVRFWTEMLGFKAASVSPRQGISWRRSPALRMHLSWWLTSMVMGITSNSSSMCMARSMAPRRNRPRPAPRMSAWKWTISGVPGTNCWRPVRPAKGRLPA